MKRLTISPFRKDVSPEVDHLDVLQHLADDALDVAVGDRHALQAVDFLDRVDEELLDFLDALDVQDVVRVDGAVGERLADADAVAFVDDQMLALRG